MSTRDEATKAAIEAGMTCYGCKSEKLGHSWHSYTDSIERFYAIAYRAGMECAAEICEGFSDSGFMFANAIREEVKK